MAADFSFGGAYTSANGNPYTFGVSDDGISASWGSDTPATTVPATTETATTRVDPKLIALAALAAVALVYLATRGGK